ncbi:MAG TPA: dihydropteroate synthase [Candidatus Dormibacteraeota bacterium]
MIAPALSERAAARYNVRLLLSSNADVLRDEVVRLGVGTHRLTVVASHAAMEALALENLDEQQVFALHHAVDTSGGALLTDATRQRAIVVMPLLTAAELNGRLAEAGPAGAELGAAVARALVARGAPPVPVQTGAHRLEFGRRTLVMGVINVTPDSFSGDGVYDDPEAAVTRGEAMIAAGADIIDVGGESTRPNSTLVTPDEELRRVIPVIERLTSASTAPVSIDTRKATVAAAALQAGASIVNDVWGLRGDADMATVVAAHPASALIVMHNQRGTEYTNLLSDVCRGLRESVAVAAEAGIAADRLIIDPGFGFAKTPAHNLELVRRLGELRAIGRPVLVGLSRKSTIGALTGGAPADQRVEGSLALAALAVSAGADIVRTHDVAATVRSTRVADAVVRGTPEHILALPPPGPTG